MADQTIRDYNKWRNNPHKADMRTMEGLVRGLVFRAEARAQLSARFATRLRGSGGPLPLVGDRIKPETDDKTRWMTPVGVFFICQNEDKCHFVNSTKIAQEKKPGVIKALLVGLKDFLMNAGSSLAAALIQASIQGLF